MKFTPIGLDLDILCQGGGRHLCSSGSWSKRTLRVDCSMSLAREHIQLFFCVVASSRGGSRKAFLGIAPVSRPGVRYTREGKLHDNSGA